MIIRRYASSCDSLIRFNCREFTIAYLSCLSFKIASTALTSLGDAPVPLNKRIGAGSFGPGGAQLANAIVAMHESIRMLRLFIRCERRLTIRYHLKPGANHLQNACCIEIQFVVVKCCALPG